LHDIELAVQRPPVPADAKTRIGLDNFEAPIQFNPLRRVDSKSIYQPHATALSGDAVGHAPRPVHHH
jgi:hypothetical protein